MEKKFKIGYLREIMENGGEHHYVLMCGDRTEELTALCRNMNIEMHLVKSS